MDLPYLTPNAAKTAAQAGDVINVLPGNYTITSSIAKNGVNWFGYPGATFSRTVTDGVGGGIFDDLNVAMSFKVDGHLNLVHTTGTTGTDQCFAVILYNSGSTAHVRCSTIICDGTDDTSNGAVLTVDGHLFLEADHIEHRGMGYTLYWVNGNLFVRAKKVKSNFNVTVSSDVQTTPTGKFWVQADEIVGGTAQNNAVIGDGSSNASAQTWIRTLEIRNEGSGPAVSAQGLGKLYVEAQKISNVTDSTLAMSNGKTWIKSMKITNGASNSIILVSGASAEAYVECQHLEQVGTGLNISSGTLYLTSQTMTGTGGTGITISGGTAHISGLTVDTSGSSVVCPVSKTGGVLVLKNCALRSNNARNTISSTSAQTVIAYGCYGSTAVHSNVTVSGNLTIGSYVI
jgi:hypothetical protein